mgnify:CR=1 FL=1|jgi:predicted DNA-binding protein with PD1-like motif
MLRPWLSLPTPAGSVRILRRNGTRTPPADVHPSGNIEIALASAKIAPPIVITRWRDPAGVSRIFCSGANKLEESLPEPFASFPKSHTIIDPHPEVAMKSSSARPGRVFIIRLEHGDVIHECLERFAAEQGIRHAALTLHGGADAGSVLVTGPRDGRSPPPIAPQTTTLDDVHEVVGTGTIFPDANGTPILHVHLACGRGRETICGCIRTGVKTWHVLEVILTELLGSTARRLPDPASGFELLAP